MNMGEEVSHLKAHVNTFYNNGALQRASEQPHLKTNQKPSQINKKVGSQEFYPQSQPSKKLMSKTWTRSLKTRVLKILKWRWLKTPNSSNSNNNSLSTTQTAVTTATPMVATTVTPMAETTATRTVVMTATPMVVTTAIPFATMATAPMTM
ncbi:hypothetical protein [Ruegeria sp.]|uniref:hypothetical protein n=1 Tax=Ruegeria sp. TaxID=1879320 RepID=UPI003B003CCF